MDALGPGDDGSRRRYIRRDRAEPGALESDQAHQLAGPPDHNHRYRRGQLAGDAGVGYHRSGLKPSTKPYDRWSAYGVSTHYALSIT